MAIEIDEAFPYPGVGQGIVTHDQWRAIRRYWGKTNGVGTYGDFVGNAFEVSADSTTGPVVKVKSGCCSIEGTFGYNLTQETLPIPGSAPSSTQSRIALVVLRSTYASKKIEIDVLPGANATTPTVPAMTRNSTMWEIPLAQVTITQATASSLPPSAVVDARDFCRNDSGRQPGEIFWWPSSNAFPAGSVVAVGQSISRVTHWEAALVWDPAGSGNLIVPDMRGVTAVGMDDMGTGTAGRILGHSTVGEIWGEQDHPITTAELPAHTHPGVVTAVPTTATPKWLVDAGTGTVQGRTVDSTIIPGTSGSTGGGSAHNNVQPSRMGYWLAALRPV